MQPDFTGKTTITLLPPELAGKIVRVVQGDEIDKAQREGFELAGVVSTEVYLHPMGIDSRVRYLLTQNPESAVKRVSEQAVKDIATAEAKAEKARQREIVYRDAQRFLLGEITVANATIQKARKHAPDIIKDMNEKLARLDK